MARQYIVGIRPGSTWTKNMCDQLSRLSFVSLASAIASREGQHGGGEGGRPRWKTTASLMGTNVTRRVGQNGPKI
jgi:hypothetical protein